MHVQRTAILLPVTASNWLRSHGSTKKVKKMAEIKKEIIIPEHTETKCMLMCDVCGREESDKTWIYKCIICERDVCSECSIYVGDHIWTMIYDDLHICDECAKSDCDCMGTLSAVDVVYINTAETVVKKWKAEIKETGDTNKKQAARNKEIRT